MFAVHLRSEGDRLLEALDEAIGVARGAGVPLEIYHAKALGRRNFHKFDAFVSPTDLPDRNTEDGEPLLLDSVWRFRWRAARPGAPESSPRC